jgi:hypothetical protein
MALSSSHHKDRAEELIKEGERVASQISRLKDDRSGATGGLRDDFTERMDELGKKAMGIWAQAQVHATLATIPDRLTPRFPNVTELDSDGLTRLEP